MQDTCSKEKCPLWRKYKERCPNFIETTWKEHDAAQPIMVSDCAPKRTMLMTQELFNRFVGVQKSNEEQRNESVRFIGVLGSIFKRLQASPEAIDITPGKDQLGSTYDQVED